MNKNEHYVVGADFGSDSVRVVILDAADGTAVGTCVHYYSRWKRGLFCDPKANQFRQHPLDYIESFTNAVHSALVACAGTGAGSDSVAERICGICIDTTGSTPSLANKEGTPLALLPEFAENPDAMFVLWKDHTAIGEADEINALCKNWGGQDYTIYSGGTYSSEWFWSKLLHIIRNSSDVKKAAYTAVEHCDWMTALLCGNTAPETIKKSRCAAGHKCLWHASWGGYPSAEFLSKLDAKLAEIVPTLGTETYTTEQIQGKLSNEWAQKLGLKEGIVVCVGAYDAHIGAVGGGAADGVMVKSIGTSTCDIILGPLPANGEAEKCVPGICGQVDGSVIAGWTGYEAGQSAYGDYYGWFRNLLLWPFANGAATSIIDDDAFEAAKEAYEKKILPLLEQECEKIDPSETSPVALDWINGRRTPNANQNLTAYMGGLSLGTDAPAFMRMLLESTAFGARAILECLEEGGVKVDTIMAIGGVARKSKIGMQILADITKRDIQITASDQSCAIGAAIFAATAAGLYSSVKEAQSKLCAGTERVHKPNPANSKIYDKLYAQYLTMGAFADEQLKK